MSGLAGQTVLVTRPAVQQLALCSALEALGARCVSLPAMVIEAIDDGDPAAQPIKNRVLDLDQYQHLIFISTNAVACGMPWIDRYWPQLPMGQCYYAIGAATANALVDWGVEPHCQQGAMNSEALLAAPELQALSGQRCLIFRGVGGREHLASELRQRGAQVDYCEVYRRTVPHYEAGAVATVLHSGLTQVVVNSGETLFNICTLAERDGVLSQLLALPVVVPSPRVAELAHQRGFQQVWLAKNATVTSVSDCLLEYCSASRAT